MMMYHRFRILAVLSARKKHLAFIFEWQEILEFLNTREHILSNTAASLRLLSPTKILSEKTKVVSCFPISRMKMFIVYSFSYFSLHLLKWILSILTEWWHIIDSYDINCMNNTKLGSVEGGEISTKSFEIANKSKDFIFLIEFSCLKVKWRNANDFDRSCYLIDFSHYLGSGAVSKTKMQIKIQLPSSQNFY